MNARLWNAFHDGEITSIVGNVPGDLRFTIEAEYLREQFADAGASFKVLVEKCDEFSFNSFDANQVARGVESVVDHVLEILSAKLDEDSLVITTVSGELILRYRSEVLALDSGRMLHVSELMLAADRAVSDQDTPKI